MKVLYYNWVDYLDPEKRGGGVSVYQRNLMRGLQSHPGIDAYFLSSGISYDVFSDTPRWERVRHGAKENADRRFEIVNSRVLAPGHFSFGHETQVDCPETRAAFMDFCRINGPFDIVHFNNLEGIPASVLSLKTELPDTKVVFSFHNYYPICPQVNLWFEERENCTDFDEGRKCTTCLQQTHDAAVIRHAGSVAYTLKRMGIAPGTRLFDRAFGRMYRYSERVRNEAARVAPQVRAVSQFTEKATRPRLAADGLSRAVQPPHKRFARRREAIVGYLNDNVDSVLCVSARVAEVAKTFGVAPDLLDVAYIGSPHAEKFAKTRPAKSVLKDDGTVTLAYLGYMRADKGFFFLLEALEALPDLLARRIHLLVAARTGPDWAMEKLRDLEPKFASIRHADGYTHDNLDALLADVDVGIVPVLWEDNLPQVAIEMHARHIPLITSDLGGAQELGDTPDMVFEAGNIDSLHEVLLNVAVGAVDLDTYWANARRPTSIAAHVDALETLYRGLREGRTVKISGGALATTYAKDRSSARIAPSAAAEVARRAPAPDPASPAANGKANGGGQTISGTGNGTGGPATLQEKAPAGDAGKDRASEGLQ